MDKQCLKCNLFKPTEDFYKSQRGSKCKECTLLETREYKRIKRQDLNFKTSESLKQKERRVRLWQNYLIHESRRRHTDNDIDIEFINELFDKQNGLCYWFKIPLLPTSINKHPQKPSLDRLDNKKGYTKDNVVLCCYSANIGRNENDLETWSSFINTLFDK